MKLLSAVVLGLALQLTCLAETPDLKLTATTGSKYIYATATLSNPLMANHSLTARVRIVNSTTGVAVTSWASVTRLGATAQATVHMTRTDGDFQAEADYTATCPVGRYATYWTSKLLAYKVGYSLNCMYKIPGTEAVSYDITTGAPYYVAKYSKVPGCYVSCAVQDTSTFTTPYGGGKASDNIQFRYWWFSVAGFKTCLDFYESSRNSCYQGSCGEFTTKQ